VYLPFPPCHVLIPVLCSCITTCLCASSWVGRTGRRWADVGNLHYGRPVVRNERVGRALRLWVLNGSCSPCAYSFSRGRVLPPDAISSASAFPSHRLPTDISVICTFYSCLACRALTVYPVLRTVRCSVDGVGWRIYCLFSIHLCRGMVLSVILAAAWMPQRAYAAYGSSVMPSVRYSALPEKRCSGGNGKAASLQP
jgi:hypothetical protein